MMAVAKCANSTGSVQRNWPFKAPRQLHSFTRWHGLHLSRYTSFTDFYARYQAELSCHTPCAYEAFIPASDVPQSAVG